MEIVFKIVSVALVLFGLILSAGFLSHLGSPQDAPAGFLLLAGLWSMGASALRALWGKPVKDTLLVGAGCILAASTLGSGSWAGIGLGLMAAAVALAGFNAKASD